eukprot:1753985-Rhodomonas_salina.2
MHLQWRFDEGGRIESKCNDLALDIEGGNTAAGVGLTASDFVLHDAAFVQPDTIHPPPSLFATFRVPAACLHPHLDAPTRRALRGCSHDARRILSAPTQPARSLTAFGFGRRSCGCSRRTTPLLRSGGSRRQESCSQSSTAWSPLLPCGERERWIEMDR